jgi:hypothetical protein
MLGVGGSLNSPTCNPNVAKIFNQSSKNILNYKKDCFTDITYFGNPHCKIIIFKNLYFCQILGHTKKFFFNLAKNLNSWQHCQSPWFPSTARLFLLLKV